MLLHYLLIIFSQCFIFQYWKFGSNICHRSVSYNSKQATKTMQTKQEINVVPIGFWENLSIIPRHCLHFVLLSFVWFQDFQWKTQKKLIIEKRKYKICITNLFNVFLFNCLEQIFFNKIFSLIFFPKKSCSFFLLFFFLIVFWKIKLNGKKIWISN